MAGRVLITGAAGNLGGLLAAALAERVVIARRPAGAPSAPPQEAGGGRASQPADNRESLQLNLLIHNKDVPAELRRAPGVRVFRGDLADKATLRPALEGVDTVVHFAGVLFRARPEKFLPETNVGWFDNLLDTALESGVKRVILISFPHVEGETTPDRPARGSLLGSPGSAHARTRLEEERHLFARCTAAGGKAEAGEQMLAAVEAVSLRAGMVYGRGILMIDAAQWFARRRLLGVWRKPTWIHLISRDDFLAATIAAIEKPGISGIYHLGDEGVQTLREFLDAITAHRGNPRPWRMPVWMIMTAARAFELFSLATGRRAPLTRDFVRIGMASYYGDTSRMRAELLPSLRYRTFREGIDTL